MTTVPKAGDPPPANNAQTKTVSDAMSGNYGRPASGGAPEAGRPQGTPGPTAGPGPTQGFQYDMNGAPPSTGGTQVGPDMGHGATKVGPTGDRPSGGKESASGGTVGQSTAEDFNPKRP